MALSQDCFWFSCACFHFPDDIVELYNTPLKPGHAAAFSDDCDSTSSKVAVRGAGNQVSFGLVQ